MNVRNLARAAFLSPPPLPPAARLLRFLAIGLIGLATDIACYTALFSLLPSAVFCRAASVILATFVTWRLNRALTFGASAGAAAHEALRYTLTALIAQGFNYGLFLGLRSIIHALPDQVLIVICAVAAASLSFTGQNIFTFRPARAPSA